MNEIVFLNMFPISLSDTSQNTTYITEGLTLKQKLLVRSGNFDPFTYKWVNSGSVISNG